MVDMESVHDIIFESKHDDTAQWIFEEPPFIKWEKCSAVNVVMVFRKSYVYLACSFCHAIFSMCLTEA
jgi:hypothetical protein